MPEQSRYGYYGPQSATWKLGGEAAILLGGGRAVLLQLAHPLVAEGVYAHSSYLTKPFARTMNTFLLGQALTFGSTTQANKAARTINRLHTHVHGSLSSSAGGYSSGMAYQARDPELLLWVHATLIDTILQIYPLLVGPLTLAEQDQYYQESKVMAGLLGLSEEQMPQSAQDLRRYVHEMAYSGKLGATPQARELVQTVLFPPLPAVARPLLHLQYQFTNALLPEPVRALYGMEWSARQQRVFDLTTRGSRAFLPNVPQSLRMLPITRKLMRETLKQSA